MVSGDGERSAVDEFWAGKIDEARANGGVTRFSFGDVPSYLNAAFALPVVRGGEVKAAIIISGDLVELHVQERSPQGS
jgi:hypothetical protein